MIDFEKYSDEKICVTIPVTLPEANNNVKVFMKRTDLIHPVISGNKWYKMKYNIIEMQKQGFDTLLTLEALTQIIFMLQLMLENYSGLKLLD